MKYIDFIKIMFYINKFILTKKKIGYKIFENKRFLLNKEGFI